MAERKDLNGSIERMEIFSKKKNDEKKKIPSYIPPSALKPNEPIIPMGKTLAEEEEDKKKRHRRTANEIERHYKCPCSCAKSYGYILPINPLYPLYPSLSSPIYH
jgi:hypothetical protein